MCSESSHVSIGMPVFNGERYLEETLDSILAQTYMNYELIICDNASNDRTQQICRDYAAKDNRIRYYRNKKNIGASKNYNLVFKLSSGVYFIWVAHDDLLAPDFLAKCVNVLERDQSIIVCYPKTKRIDENGSVISIYEHNLRISSEKPHERFGDLLRSRKACSAIFGVMRKSVLGKTPLMGEYIAADTNLLAELGLLGRIYEFPEPLFFRRIHPEAYSHKYYGHKLPDYREQLDWWTKEVRVKLPNLKNCIEYFKSITRVPLKCSERILCYRELGDWMIEEGLILIGRDIDHVILQPSTSGRKISLAFKRIIKPIYDKIVKNTV